MAGTAPAVALLAVACACAAAGCTAPTFRGLAEPDASVAEPGQPALTAPDDASPWLGDTQAASPDAEVDRPSLDPSDADSVVAQELVPDWADELAGAYVRRTISYGFDAQKKLFRTMTVLSLALLEADEEQGGFTLTTEACSVELTWPASAVSVVHTGAPAPAAVAMRQHVYFDEGDTRSFQLAAAALRFGFDVDRLGVCSAGTLRPPYPDQRWLVLPPLCQCSASPQSLPSRYDDCRLADSEDDGAPGFTLVEKRSGVSVASYGTAIEVACNRGAGSVTPDGRITLDEQVLTAMQCVNAALDGCVRSPVPSCELARTELVKFDGRAPTCSDVLAAGLETFTTAPGAPSTCEAP